MRARLRYEKVELVQPILKWAGGKRWLFDDNFIGRIPSYKRYIEPFLGGGAGFFALQPSKSILSDVNPDLINLYEVVRDRPKRLQDLMECHQACHSREYYYDVRDYKPRGRIQAAARMLYLNRACYNGLYRLNKRGEFNVPIGTKTLVSLPSDNFKEMSNILSRAILRVSDFASTIEMASEGDLVFVDPPYTVKHNMNGFVKYNENIFSWSDQERLRDCVADGIDRGVQFILTNANHPSVRTLYKGIGTHSIIERHSVISGKANGRSQISELLVRA